MNHHEGICAAKNLRPPSKQHGAVLDAMRRLKQLLAEADTLASLFTKAIECDRAGDRCRPGDMRPLQLIRCAYISIVRAGGLDARTTTFTLDILSCLAFLLQGHELFDDLPAAIPRPPHRFPPPDPFSSPRRVRAIGTTRSRHWSPAGRG